jgi:hypothetical protein
VPVQPSAKSSALYRGAALAMKAVGRETKNDINRTTRGLLNEIWRAAVSARASSKMDALVLAKGARAVPGNPAKVVAASARRPLRGGTLVPDTGARAWEFGTTQPEHESTYSRKTRSGAAEVTRHTKRQLPDATNRGRVIYPAWADTAPRMIELWVQTIVYKASQALENKGK